MNWHSWRYVCGLFSNGTCNHAPTLTLQHKKDFAEKKNMKEIINSHNTSHLYSIAFQEDKAH